MKIYYLNNIFWRLIIINFISAGLLFSASQQENIEKSDLELSKMDDYFRVYDSYRRLWPLSLRYGDIPPNSRYKSWDYSFKLIDAIKFYEILYKHFTDWKALHGGYGHIDIYIINENTNKFLEKTYMDSLSYYLIQKIIQTPIDPYKLNNVYKYRAVGQIWGYYAQHIRWAIEEYIKKNNFFPQEQDRTKKPAPKKTASETPHSTITPYYILGIPDKATDAQILGLTQEQSRNKATVKKAYNKLSLIWHPDRLMEMTNTVAKAKYSSPELLKAFGPDPDDKKIPDRKKVRALSEEVFKLIANAYQRLTS